MDSAKKINDLDDDFIVIDEDSDDYEEYDDEDEIENFDDGENCAENSKNKIVATEVSNNTTLLKIDKFFKELRLVETERWDDICEEYHTLKHYVINADLFYNGDISIDLDARLIVYGDICAKNIFINSCIEVIGNVKATYIEAKTSVKISGNVNALDFKADSFDVYNFDYYDIEIGGNLNLSGYIYADNITVGGYIKVYGIIAYNNIIAQGSIFVDTGIRALGDVVSSEDIISEEDIIANGKIHAGEEIIAKGQIKSGGSISADWNIKADKNICADDYISSGGSIKSGKGIIAGGHIKAKGFIRCENRIFAGISYEKTSATSDKTISCSNLRNGEVCYGKLIETSNDDHDNYTANSKTAISYIGNIGNTEFCNSNTQIYDMTIEELDFSVRTFNCLKRAGLDTVGDLTEKTYDDMIKVRNLGRKSLEEVILKLHSLGVTLKDYEKHPPIT